MRSCPSWSEVWGFFLIISNKWLLAILCDGLKDSAPMPDACRLGQGMHVSIGGPCLSPSTGLRRSSASWSPSCVLRSAQLMRPDGGVNGFGALCRIKRPVLSETEGASADGPKPGNAENHVDVRARLTSAWHVLAHEFLLANTRLVFRYPL